MEKFTVNDNLKAIREALKKFDDEDYVNYYDVRKEANLSKQDILEQFNNLGNYKLVNSKQRADEIYNNIRHNIFHDNLDFKVNFKFSIDNLKDFTKKGFLFNQRLDFTPIKYWEVKTAVDWYIQGKYNQFKAEHKKPRDITYGYGLDYEIKLQHLRENTIDKAIDRAKKAVKREEEKEGASRFNVMIRVGGYDFLDEIKEHDITIEDIAKEISKKTSFVNNLELLKKGMFGNGINCEENDKILNFHKIGRQ